jgi:16S rRNA (cytosine967-C5)-methyltransferase
MRLGGRAGAAIEVLADVFERHRPAADALRDWGHSHRFAGSADRSAIGNLVYDALRRRASHAWRMNDETPGMLIAGVLLGDWQYEVDELEDVWAQDRFAPQFDWRAAWGSWTSRELAAAPEDVRADIPSWCVGEFAGAFGDSWVGEGAALAGRPPLDLRVNSLKAGNEQAAKALSRTGALPAAFAPSGLRIAAGRRDERLPNVQASQAYQRGWIEIQDEGSQLAAALAVAKPGEQVLDFCAGAGGKTLALAANMENRGQVHAHDADGTRLAPIHERLRRAGTRNVQVHGPEDDLTPLLGRMDCVFVDAPCSGSGTWRRRPDAKWRLGEAGLDKRTQEQSRILDAAAPFVRPGGRLVYATCSVFPCENATAIARFLSDSPQFSPESFAGEWKPLFVEAHVLADDRSMLQMSPASTQTDGFFVANLVRMKS